MLLVQEVTTETTPQQKMEVSADSNVFPTGKQYGWIVSLYSHGKRTIIKILVSIPGFKPFRYETDLSQFPKGVEPKLGDVISFNISSSSTKKNIIPINFEIVPDKPSINNFLESVQEYIKEGNLPSCLVLSVAKFIDLCVIAELDNLTGQALETEFALRYGYTPIGSVGFYQNGVMGPATGIVFVLSDTETKNHPT